MNFKKIIVTTSSLLITATVLSQIYSYSSSLFTPRSPDFSAFANLASNITAIASQSNIVVQNKVEERNDVNAEIIRLIEGEVRTAIKKTRYTVNSARPKYVEEKIQTIAATPLKSRFAEDLSSFEINNKELVELYGINAETVAFEKLEPEHIAMVSAPVIKDEVAMAQASTDLPSVQTDEVKMIQPSVEDKDEDMVMFDYSQANEQSPIMEKSMDKKLYERPLSATVRNAIQREMSSTPLKKLVPRPDLSTQSTLADNTKEEKEKAIAQIDAEDNIIYDYSDKRTKTSTEDAISTFAVETKDPVMNTHFTIRAKEINLNTQKAHRASSFEFVPDFDRSERLSDIGGDINVEYSMSGTHNVESGLIVANGMIPTRVELPLGAASAIEVPLINEDGIQKFLQKQKLNIEGNLVLLAIDSLIVDTEINTTFGARIFFNKNFRPLDSSNGASYVMYAGVKTGNILVRYLLNNKESAQKIIYVGDGELYFEDADFSASHRETYTFTTKNILGTKKKELVIDPSQISYLNTNIIAKKKALNAYEIKVPEQVTGMRKYLEFKHLKDSIFVGTTEQRDIEVPGNDFITKVMEMNDVSNLKDRCMVQINLAKDIRDLKVNGKNRSGEMFVETTFLDKDGNFSRESELADKIFIVGEQEGLISARLDYTDGSSEFLKTFCSDGTYLVEQL